MARSSLAALALLAALPLFAKFPDETERLMAAGRLWVTVQYFHPHLALKFVDWDDTFIDTVPKIRAASNPAQYCAAVAGMLGALHDPQTRVLSETEEPSLSPTSAPQLYVLRTAGETAFLTKLAPPEVTVVELPGCRAQVRLNSPVAEPLPVPVEQPPTNALSEPYPPVEARLLAAIKTWGVIHYFFAYKDLVDEDWDDTFAFYLPKFIAARDATDYNLAFADLLTQLTDTNTSTHSKTLDTYFGEAGVGLRIRLLDKYPIVTDVFDPAAKAAGIRPGDVIKRIDNESITDRFHRFVQYIPASTPQRSGFDTIQRVINGPPDTTVSLTVENAQGEAHVVNLVRHAGQPPPQRSTEVVRILPGNIGYLDLDRLQPAETDAAFNRLKDTKALVLDLRGHAPAAFQVASHLASDTNVAAALVTTPIALHPDLVSAGVATQSANTFEVRTLPKPREPDYKGKTVALIDERTIGESEYAALLFEVANKTEFVGAASAGAVSRIVSIPLPGGITLTFSAEDVRHANGGKLQRLGIQPNTPASATAKGLREGKDEVLDAAIAFLSPATRQLASATPSYNRNSRRIR